MSEAQQNVRVRLGPIASALIEGGSDNRQEALDRAILELQQAASQTGGSSTLPASGDSQMAHLTSQIEAQGEILSALRLQVMKEMQMTRLLVASLMSETDASQQQLLVFATEAVETLRRDSGLVMEIEQANLASQEAAFQATVRREMQQGGEGIEQDQEQEIER